MRLFAGMASPKRSLAILTVALIAVATLLAASPRTSAQLPSASVRSLGLSGSDTGDRDERPFDEAPADLKSRLPQPLVPSARIGAAYRAVDDVTISGEFHYRFGDTLAAWPTLHAGVGAEYRPADFVELRAGAALISDAVQFSGGASLVLEPYNLSIAMAATTTGGLGAQIGLLSFGIRYTPPSRSARQIGGEP